MGAACTASAHAASSNVAAIFFIGIPVEAYARDAGVECPARHSTLQLLLGLAAAVGRLQLLGREEAIPVGVDLVEVRGEARRGFRLFAADAAVAVGIELLQEPSPAL